MKKSTETGLNIEIIRCGTTSGAGYDYKIQLPYGTRPTGSATLSFRRVGSYISSAYFKTNNIVEECRKRGVGPEEIIGHLRLFYPNGCQAKDRHMRKGVGGFVLNCLIRDLLREKGRLLYTLPTTVPMKNFLVKNRFTPCSLFRDQYFLNVGS